MPLFKNLIAYRIAPEWTPPALDVIEAEMQRLAFQPCGATQELSVGWLPPRGEENGARDTAAVRGAHGREPSGRHRERPAQVA